MVLRHLLYVIALLLFGASMGFMAVRYTDMAGQSGSPRSCVAANIRKVFAWFLGNLAVVLAPQIFNLATGALGAGSSLYVLDMAVSYLGGFALGVFWFLYRAPRSGRLYLLNVLSTEEFEALDLMMVHRLSGPEAAATMGIPVKELEQLVTSAYERIGDRGAAILKGLRSRSRRKPEKPKEGPS